MKLISNPPAFTLSRFPVCAAPRDWMLDQLVSKDVPHAVGLVLDGYEAARTQTQEFAGRAVHQFGTDRERMTHMGAALHAAATAGAEAKLKFGVPAQKFVLVFAEHIGIQAG